MRTSPPPSWTAWRTGCAGPGPCRTSARRRRACRAGSRWPPPPGPRPGPRASRAPRQPEGQPQGRHPRGVHLVAPPYWLAGLVRAPSGRGAARCDRRPAGPRPRTPRRCRWRRGQHHRQRVGGDDGEEGGAGEPGGTEADPGRIEGQHRHLLLRRGTVDQVHGRLPAVGEGVEDARDLARDAGAHQDAVDPGEHGPVEGGQRGRPELGHEIDPHPSAMPLAGQDHLDEGRQDGEVAHQGPLGVALHPHPPVRGSRLLPHRHEEAVEHAPGHALVGERLDGAAQMASLVTVLKAACHHAVQRGARDHPHAAAVRRDGAREPPAGDGDAHPTLDDPDLVQPAVPARGLVAHCGHVGPSSRLV